jgi:hypothetical protein
MILMTLMGVSPTEFLSGAPYAAVTCVALAGVLALCIRSAIAWPLTIVPRSRSWWGGAAISLPQVGLVHADALRQMAYAVSDHRLLGRFRVRGPYLAVWDWLRLRFATATA